MEEKKSIYLTICVTLVLVSIFGISSCSQHEKEIDGLCNKDISIYNDMLDRNSDVKNELSALMDFNQSLLSKRVHTRGWFGRFAATVSADVLGAYGGFQASVGVAALITAATGGTAGPAAGVAVLGATAFIAGGASYGAYAGLKPDCTYSIPIPELIPSSDILIQVADHPRDGSTQSDDVNSFIYVNELYLSVGEIHNEILETMILPDVSTRALETTNFINNNEVTFFTKDQLVNMYEDVNSKIQTYINTGYDYDALISELSKNGFTTKNTEDILRLYLEMLFKYAKDVEDLRTVSDTYEEVIINSENLSIEDKNILLISIYTAINSMELWVGK